MAVRHGMVLACLWALSCMCAPAAADTVRPEHPVAAGETVHIPGGDGDLLMASAGLAGGESLLALCTSEAAAVPGGAEGAFFEQLFPMVGERQTLDAYNLSVIDTPDDMVPGYGETAQAVAAILVR
ncbi:MAG: hypothetical protein OXF88_03155 [Rhodobacteraceae bacterium]|nr:hypothetical protein [Paracoccaceae bacterium]MCY4137882.1 hypothetical protein [Paracoccaceae bacterium]